MLCIVNRRNNYKEDNKKNVKSVSGKINLFPRLSRREFGKAFMRYQQCAQRVADLKKKRPYANCKKKNQLQFVNMHFLILGLLV